LLGRIPGGCGLSLQLSQNVDGFLGILSGSILVPALHDIAAADGHQGRHVFGIESDGLFTEFRHFGVIVLQTVDLNQQHINVHQDLGLRELPLEIQQKPFSCIGIGFGLNRRICFVFRASSDQ
jgi:hypothetical protein